MKKIRELSDLKTQNADKIEKLFEDNQKLQDLNNDIDYRLEQTNNERNRLASKVEECNIEVRNLTSMLRSKEDELISTLKDLESANKYSSRIQVIV